MQWWKILALMAIPAIRAAGEAKKAEDADNIGKDDLIGVSLVYAADMLDAIVNGKAIPKAPEALR